VDKNKGLNVAGFDFAQPATRLERSRRPDQGSVSNCVHGLICFIQGWSRKL